MRIFGQLIAAIFEKVAANPLQSDQGRVYFQTTSKRPLLDDDTTVDQLMIEKHLPEARRDTKVQLDGAETGVEVIGTLASSLGGTDVSSLTGKSLQGLRVNAGETAMELAPITATPAFLVSTKSANYTILDADGIAVILVDDTTADRTITLPLAANNTDRRIVIKNISTQKGKVSVTGNGVEEIEGFTSIDLDFKYCFMEVICDGTEWHIVNENITSQIKQYVPTVTTNLGVWTTQQDTIVPYRTLAGDWRAIINITGTTSVTGTTNNLTISALTYKTGSGNPVVNSKAGGDSKQAFTNPGTSIITIDAVATTTSWSLGGDIELDGKPTFVE